MQKKYFLWLCISLISTNIYSQDNKYSVVNSIIISGNKKTKEYIIKRELLFEEGDTLKNSDINKILIQCKQNLFNTSLFNFITINIIDESVNRINIFILLEERWYIFPYPILEYADRNFSVFLHEKNWNRINYGLMLTHYNFRGRAERLKIKFRFGYKEQFQFFYQIPYLGKNKKHSVSVEHSWYRQHEAAYNIKNDKLLYFKDNDEYMKKYHTSVVSYGYRNKHYTTHNFSMAYTYAKVTDTIIKLNNNYFGNYKNNTQFLSVRYSLSIDKRDYKFYPLIGYNILFVANKNGLKILDKNFAHSWKINLEAYKYLKLNKRFYAGMGTAVQLSANKKQAFFTHQTLGYKEHLRAYEYYVVDGQNYLSTRAFIKYAIVPMNVQYLQKWKWSKFNKIHYSLLVNLFFDSGYSYCENNSENNKLPNRYQYSSGIGLDLVAYYDLILRFEYSINRYKQSGFFVHIGKAF